MELKLLGTERVLNTIYGRTEQGFDEKMDNVIRRIEAKILVAHQDFFKQLVQVGIDVTSAPNLGIYSPTWKPLTRKYQERRKKQRGVYYNRFFKNTGDLKTTLSSLSATSVFGKPLIIFKRGSFDRGDSMEVRYEQWKGQTKRRRVIRDRKGRILPGATKVPKKLKSEISVNVFPNVTEDLRSGLNLNKFFDQKTAFKLGNTGNARPLVANYMNWYINTRVRKIIKGSV